KAETGALDELTQKQINEVMVSYVLNHYNNSDEAKTSMKDTFDSVQKLLNRLLNFMSISEKELKAMYDIKAKMEKLEATLPEGCNIADLPEVITFAKKLDKPYYNHSQAGKLLNVQRQTISNWLDKKHLGLVGYTVGSRNVIDKIEIIRFYRVWKGVEWNF
ncbi:MAG TPA: hypothetical protein VNG53_02580, partial [Bacteroidia bacterium]|nr:hypothetical protein [Bacteroidia bacterium]